MEIDENDFDLNENQETENSVEFNPRFIKPVRIKILQANLTDDAEGENEDVRARVKSFNLATALEQEIFEEVQLVKHILNIKISLSDEDENPIDVSCAFRISFKYFIQNMSNFLISEDDETELTDVMKYSIAGISFSTARGIILTRLLGTPLEGVILPVVSPIDLFTQEDA